MLVGERLAELTELLARRLHFDASIIACLSAKLMVWHLRFWLFGVAIVGKIKTETNKIEKCVENAFALYRGQI
jgi:hypothetical protein